MEQRVALQQMYERKGYMQTLLCPPIDNPRNLVDFPLYMRHYKVCVLGVTSHTSACSKDASCVVFLVSRISMTERRVIQDLR